jgi:hypothetical protein
MTTRKRPSAAEWDSRNAGAVGSRLAAPGGRERAEGRGRAGFGMTPTAKLGAGLGEARDAC